jgi:DNA ligase-1
MPSKCLNRNILIKVSMQYSRLAELYTRLEDTSKRLEKTFFIAEFFKKCSKDDLREIVYLLQGRVFAQSDERKLGMSSKLLVKVIAQSTGEHTEKIENEWKKLGDLGLVAERFIERKKQVTLFKKSLSVSKVVENLTKLSGMEGEGTVGKKVALVSELMSSASPSEAKYIVRTVAEELRTGVGDSVIRDALMWAFYPPVEGIMIKCKKCQSVNPKVEKCLECGHELDISEKEDREKYNSYIDCMQNAFNMTNDSGIIAEVLKEKGPKGLEHLVLTVGVPIKVMLYTKVKDIKEGFEVVGRPAMIEPKLDGFRMQIHVSKKGVALFTRNLEDVTRQFPDVVNAVKNHVHSKDVILDSEVVGIDPKTKRVVPFQNISQRIKRKYDVEVLVKQLPVVVNIFDVIELNGENMLDIEFKERRKRLRAIIKDEKNKIELLEQLVTDDAKKAEKYYQECLAKGHEGVMMKNIHGIYKPGKRVGYGVKIKPVMESLDLVIVGAEWGEGKRANWLSSFTVACKDDDQLKEIGKVGTGIKEKSEEGVSFEELTGELKKYIVQEKGRSVIVKPKIVVEVIFEEIQKSPSYSSGYALRFPRIVRLRVDKSISDIATIEEIKHFYQEQK